MPKRSRRFAEALSKVDRMKQYEPNEAIQLVKELSTAKFEEWEKLLFLVLHSPSMLTLHPTKQPFTCPM